MDLDKSTCYGVGFFAGIMVGIVMLMRIVLIKMYVDIICRNQSNRQGGCTQFAIKNVSLMPTTTMVIPLNRSHCNLQLCLCIEQLSFNISCLSTF